MENIVTLEQLDLRDQWIKQYINEHSQSGGSSNDYIPICLFTTSKYVDDGHGRCRCLYLGFPTGTDLTGLSLKYLRKSRYSERDKREDNHFRCTGFHEVWYPPYFDGKTRFDPLIKLSLSEDIIFTKHGYDYYEVFGLVDNKFYHMNRYINMDTDEFRTGYEFKNDDGNTYPVKISMILRHKLGGIVIVKNNKIISNFARFAAVPSPESSPDIDNYSIRIFNNDV